MNCYNDKTKFDIALDNIRGTSCLTDDIEFVEGYIDWLEVMIRFGYAKDYSGAAPEELRKEYSNRE